MTANSFGSRAALGVAGSQYEIFRLDAAGGPVDVATPGLVVALD